MYTCIYFYFPEIYGIWYFHKCTVYFYHFETFSTPRLSGCHGVLREHIGIIRHWPFCRSTATGNCLLWYGNRKWRLDGTNCNLFLSLFLSISLFSLLLSTLRPQYLFTLSLFLSFFLPLLPSLTLPLLGFQFIMFGSFTLIFLFIICF